MGTRVSDRNIKWEMKEREKGKVDLELPEAVLANSLDFFRL